MTLCCFLFFLHNTTTQHHITIIMVKKRATRNRDAERQTMRKVGHATPSNTTSTTAILSDELVSQLGDDGGSIPLVMPASSKKHQAAKALPAEPSELDKLRQASRLTSKQKKRISVLQSRLEAESTRKSLLSRLNQTQLNPDQQVLLSKSDSLGKVL
jgi:hypothetical protein